MNTTKKAIADSLKRLLERKSITKVTIADITQECGLSRMTFYYHFKDIYDLVEWICEEDAREAISTNRTYETWQQGFKSLLEAVRANRAFVMNVYRSIDRTQIERYVLRATETLLEDVIENQAQGLNVSPEAKRRVSRFYTHAFIGTVIDWINDDLREEPSQIVNTTAAIMQDNFRRSLERLSQ